MDNTSLIEVESRELFKLANTVLASVSSAASKVILIVPVEDDSSAAELSVKFAATVSATAETTVCLIDGNFAVPSIARYYAKTSSLESALSSPQSFQQMLQTSNANGSFLALAPATQRDGAKSATLLKELKQLLQSNLGGIVIVLAPPAHNLYFFSEIVGAVSGAVIAVEAHQTRRQQAKSAVKELGSLGLPLLGAVLTGRTYPIPNFVYDRL